MRRNAIWLVVLIVVPALPMLFSSRVWYFPNSRTWVLCAVIGLLAMSTAVFVLPKQLHSARQRRNLARWPLVFFLGLVWGLGMGIAMPAAWARWQGPETRITARVSSKAVGYAKCPNRIYLADPRAVLGGRFCVSREVFNSVRQDQKVEVDVREGPFGVFAFSMRAAEPGPE
jgi:hypothetical protein